jgi:peptide/nickel transport system permease protein
MREYALRRLIMLVPVLLAVSVAIFLLMRVVPGDVTHFILQDAGSNQEAVQALRHEIGLDVSLPEQYVRWIGGVLRGDLGRSLLTHRSVGVELRNAAPVSLEVALLAIIISVIVAVPAGILSAIRQDSPLDYLARFVSIGALSIPAFWLGTLLLVLPSIWFHWTPPIPYTGFTAHPWRNIEQITLPALALGLPASGVTMRMVRAQMLEVLRQDYVRTAWAKGLSGRLVVWRHALKNTMIPVVTIIGNQLGFLIGGTVITETIFSLPGVGRLTLDAVSKRDYPQIQADVLFIAIVFVLLNLVIDLSYSWFDPRIHYGNGV